MRPSVDDIIAHAVYDPVARRQRYLQSRHLKGRRHTLPPVKVGVGSRVVDANTPIGSARHYSGLAAQRQAASNARQISAIQGRLDKLKSVLKQLLAKQKAESQAKKTTTKKTTSSTTKKTQSKPKTAAQKEAAKKSLDKARKAAAKNKAKQPVTHTPLSLSEQITRTRAAITQVEAMLRAAKARAQNQTASNGR